MGTILKAAAVLLVIGGVWVWANGHAVTNVAVRPSSLAASAGLARVPVQGAFDHEGTIMIDPSQGSGVSYILYTEYSEGGSPRVMTKRLVFRNQDECADLNLPCATRQPGPPVSADEKVRVVGVIREDSVEVSELYRL